MALASTAKFGGPANKVACFDSLPPFATSLQGCDRGLLLKLTCCCTWATSATTLYDHVVAVPLQTQLQLTLPKVSLTALRSIVNDAVSGCQVSWMQMHFRQRLKTYGGRSKSSRPEPLSEQGPTTRLTFFTPVKLHAYTVPKNMLIPYVLL